MILADGVYISGGMLLLIIIGLLIFWKPWRGR